MFPVQQQKGLVDRKGPLIRNIRILIYIRVFRQVFPITGFLSL
jgi:hypothetical protein